MITPTVIWISVFLYSVFLLSVALWVRWKDRNKKTGLLSAKVSGPVLIMTYVASLVSVWIFFSGPGAYYRGGIGYWVSEMSYIAVFPVVAHFTMNKVWIVNHMTGSRLMTPADFYDLRFRSPVLRVILGTIFLATSFPYVSSVLIAIGQAAVESTDGGISYSMAVLGVGLLMTLFVCIGGTKSAAMADTVQGLLFISLLWFIVYETVKLGFGGDPSKPLEAIHETVPEFFSYPGPNGWVGNANRFGYPFSCAVGWTIMLPHVFVRSGYFGQDLKSQRRLQYAAPIFQAIIWTGTMCVGLLGLALVSGLDASKTELLIPYILKNLFFDLHPRMAKFLMLSFFLGTCAVGLSTANAFLSVSSSIVYQDFLCKTFGLKIPEEKMETCNRIIIASIGIISTVLALHPPQLIFTIVMFAIALVMPLFPILVMGIYWKRTTKQAAIAGSVVGTILVLLTYFVWNLGDTWYGTFGMLGSVITAVVVTLCTKQDPADSEEFYRLLDEGHRKLFVTEK